MIRVFLNVYLTLTAILVGTECVASSVGDRESDRTTPFLIKSHIHLGNLDGRIESLSVVLRFRPIDYLARIKLSEAIYERAFYTGELDQIQESIDELEISRKQIKKNPKILNKVLLLLVSRQMSLHRFSTAQETLELAKKNGASRAEVEPYQMDINWNRGLYKTSINYYRNNALNSPNFRTIMRLAILEHQLGNYLKAEELYKKSLALFSGGDPVHYAWALVQFGIHKLELSKLEEAKSLFKKAIAIAPDYVLALEHLAETVAKHGDIPGAISLYKKVTGLTNNPEFVHQLAQRYSEIGEIEKSRVLSKRAYEEFNKQLQIFPKAMYAHAVDFYLDKNLNIALDLANKNLKERPSSESYVALAEVQLKLKNKERAKQAIQRALEMPLKSKHLCDLALQLKVPDTKLSPTCVINTPQN